MNARSCSVAKAVLSFAVVFLFLTAIDLRAQMRLTVGPAGITAAGITPRGEAVFLGRSVTHIGGVPRLERHAFVERDDDGDGVVTYALEEMPQYSVWVAVDAQNGSFATAPSEGLRARTITLSPQEWRQDDDAVDVGRPYVDFLLVRPGKGSWVLNVFEGGMRDADGRNDASLRLRTSDMQPLGGKDSPPPRAAKHDVLVIIDPRSLDMTVIAAE